MTGRQASVENLVEAQPGWLDPLDLQGARLLGDLVGESEPTVRLALALASRQVRLGHVCLDLRATTAAPGPLDDEGLPLPDLRWPPLAAWLAALDASQLVASVPDGAAADWPTTAPVPLVLEQPSGRLYLRRWWDHEAALAAALQRRAEAPAPYDAATLDAGLVRLFPPAAGPADTGRQDQAAAAALATRRRLAVITGGPGTGKTTTVVRLLALLIEQAQAAGQPPPRVLLLAPTGKAAGRMEESVVAALARLPVAEEVRAAIPTSARTIHRALGPRLDGSWRHDTAYPLAADVVVVDEASMIDVALMHALVTAVREDARLVVLGDRDQLASVEAGAVLADICGSSGGDEPSASTDGPPIARAIARLSYSFRFGAATGIGALARAIQAGDADTALALLADPTIPDVSLVASAPVARNRLIHSHLAALVRDGYGAYLDALDSPTTDSAAVGAALLALGNFRVLCAHRRGPTGVGVVGGAVIEALTRTGRIAEAGEHWRGRPILVTRNDDALRLYNGDVGLIAPDAAMDGRLRAFFPGPDGPRAVAPPRLPPHETVFAMSIHKSQGSEFGSVAIMLPDVGSPLLTRELLYTAVTRARNQVTLFAQPEAIRAAIDRRAERASGLRQRLWGV
jgi:exodeoxyribonuclease V alpha subunit